MEVIYPTKFQKIKWEQKGTTCIPKINDNKQPHFPRNVHGCSLYWQLRYNLYNALKKNNPLVKWVQPEYGYYCNSFTQTTKKGYQKKIAAFADIIIVYRNYFICLEVNENGPHSTINSTYYKNEAEWLRRKTKDYEKQTEILNRGGIFCTINETETFNNVINEIYKIFIKIDKHENNK